MVLELREGTRVGRYRLVRPLARGGMGAIWVARDERLERDVAVKLLPETLLSDDGARRRFEREARALARLLHPNVVTIFDVGAEDPGTGQEVPFLVMELVPGHSLLKEIEEGPVPPERAVNLMRQVAEALGAAHAAGIVHRDLKPSNIVVEPGDHVKVLDFGLARLLRPGVGSVEQTLTAPGMVLGSCAYMAPEQALGHEVGPASDVFSCGAVLYELLTGRRAFMGPTPVAVLQAVVRTDYQPLVEVAPATPAWLATVVERCLRREEGRRYADGTALARDLGAVPYDETPTLARTAQWTPVPEGVRVERRRRATRWSALTAVAMAAALVGGIFAGRAGHERRRPDPGRWKVRTLIDGPGQIAHPAWDDAGERLAVEHRVGDHGELLVVPAAGGEVQVVARGDPGEILSWPRFAPDGNALVVTAARANTDRLLVLPAVGGEPTLVIPSAAHGVWLPDGRLAFIRAGDGTSSVWTADPVTGREEPLLEGTPDTPWQLVVPGPGGRLALGAGSDGVELSLWVGKVGGQPQLWRAAGGRISGLSWAPGGRALLVSREMRLERVTAEGSEVVLPPVKPLAGAAVAPDGTRIAATYNDSISDLVAVDPDGGGWACLVCGVPGAGWGSVRGDQTVAYRRMEGGLRAVFLRSPTGDEKRLTDLDEDASCPTFAPDGERVAYLSRRPDGGVELRLRSLAGGGAVTLATGLIGSQFPAWSPDGRALAYSSAAPEAVWIVSAAGGAPRRLTNQGGVFPAFRPDGSMVAFVIWTEVSDPMQGAWVIPAAGGTPTKVSAQTGQLSWSPDGKWLWQLRRGSEGVELWQARPGKWSWDRRAVLDLGGPPSPQMENTPLTIDPSSGRLVMNRRTVNGQLIVLSGLDPARW